MVYLFLADGFEEIEALTAVDILRRAKIDIKTVSIKDNLEVEGRSKIRVLADDNVEGMDFKDMDMLILPGGMPGTTNLENSSKVQEVLKTAIDNKKWIAAICAAPAVLGKKGYLEGLEAVCYPGCEGDLKGAVLGSKPVVIAGNVITSKGAGTAMDFALTLVAVLKDQDTADKIKTQVVY